MRQHFEPQISLGIVPISEVKINMKSRHELPPVLKALQHIFVTPDLKKQVFEILEKKVLSGKAKTGRWGMSPWKIFVLGVVRLCMDIDYEFWWTKPMNIVPCEASWGFRPVITVPGKNIRKPKPFVWGQTKSFAAILYIYQLSLVRILGGSIDDRKKLKNAD